MPAKSVDSKLISGLYKCHLHKHECVQARTRVHSCTNIHTHAHIQRKKSKETITDLDSGEVVSGGFLEEVTAELSFE